MTSPDLLSFVPRTIRQDLGDEAVKEKLDTLYPDWWTFRGATADTPLDELPRYRAYCKDSEEVDLAYAIKPPFVVAEIVHDF